jgi:16S rRNA U1498 N3-methylase RsmE
MKLKFATNYLMIVGGEGGNLKKELSLVHQMHRLRHDF